MSRSNDKYVKGKVMGPFAVITREPEIGLSEWLNHIASNLALVRPPEREIDNPLKPGAKAIIRPVDGEVQIVVSDQCIGTIVPGEEWDVPGILVVYAMRGHSSEVKEFVADVADVLRAKVDWCQATAKLTP